MKNVSKVIIGLSILIIIFGLMTYLTNPEKKAEDLNTSSIQKLVRSLDDNVKSYGQNDERSSKRNLGLKLTFGGSIACFIGLGCFVVSDLSSEDAKKKKNTF